MHPYSHDADKRQRFIIATCAALGALIAYGLGWVYNLSGYSPPWWLDAPAFFGCFGIVWKVYDKWAWRQHILKQTLSGLVDISGEWEGSIASDYSGGAIIPSRIVIRQTATRILVELSTEMSVSYSYMATLCAGEGPDQGLRYMYSNRPRTLTPPSMTPHEGRVHLRISSDGQTLEGDYETDRHRKNTGQLVFTRLS
ncbi:hypothetical protein ABZ917_05580 [Nonomuraea wenchangensis]